LIRQDRDGPAQTFRSCLRPSKQLLFRCPEMRLHQFLDPI